MKGIDLANSPLLFTLIGIGLAAIIVYAFVSYKKARECCLKQGISSDQIKLVVRSTISATVVPSLAILVGFLILSASMGTAWPWWRLSVIGSLQYETMAADYTVKGMGLALSNLLQDDASIFAAVMVVMSIGVCTGPILVGLFGRKYATGMMKVKERSDWGTILTGTFQLAVFAVYIPIMLFKSVPNAACILTSFVVAILLGLLSRKAKWIGNFMIAICMIAGMIVGVLVEGLI